MDSAKGVVFFVAEAISEQWKHTPGRQRVKYSKEVRYTVVSFTEQTLACQHDCWQHPRDRCDSARRRKTREWVRTVILLSPWQRVWLYITFAQWINPVLN